MMPRLVFTFPLTMRTGDGIGRTKRAFALGKIAKQNDECFAVLAGDDYIPSPDLRLYRHGGTSFCRGSVTGAGGTPSGRLSFSR